MRIGIDARFLTHPQPGGFKTYTHTVISALAEVDCDHEFVLYTDRPCRRIAGVPERFDVRAVSGGNSIAREQVVLPLVMIRDGIDVAHFLSNTGPAVFGPRRVVTIHDTIPLRDDASGNRPTSRKQKLFRTYWRAMIPRAARISDLVMADSQYVGEDLRTRFRVREGKLRVVPLAINPTFFGDGPGTPPVGVDPESPFVLAFGSADGRKNHQSAVRAFCSIAQEFPCARLVLICSHSGVKDTLAPDPNVIPVGPVSSAELLWLYRNAVTLVFPSFDEGFGLPPLEAMACGTPVVVSRSGSLPEVVGEHAIYVNPHDMPGIVDGLRLILSDSDLRQRLSSEGRRHASQYNLKRMGTDLVAGYELAAGYAGAQEQATVLHAKLPASMVEHDIDQDEDQQASDLAA